MEQDSKPKMNTIGILNEIQRLYSILEENDGDLDSISIDEIQSLEDYKKDLKNKVFGLIQGRINLDSRINTCESIIEKYKSSIKTLENKKNNIDDLIKIVVNAFGESNKKGNKVMDVYEYKISVVKTEKVNYDDETCDTVAKLLIKDSTITDDDKYIKDIFKFNIEGLSLEQIKAIYEKNPDIIVKSKLDKTKAKDNYDRYKSVDLLTENKHYDINNIFVNKSYIDSIVMKEESFKLTVK